MTERLYYRDPYLRDFEATIVDRVTHDGRPAVLLDRTAFYPTSGGQPSDTGTLSDVRVLDVIDLDEDRILHVVDQQPQAPRVRGTIDWERRFDHMQQHTGQHVLSAAFDRLLGARTESFHLGTDASTIDLARELSADEIGAAEREANRVVWEDRPVTIRFADPDEARSLPLRKEPKREGLLRLIDIEGFDLSACGGTHVSRTGAIGIIAVAGVERFRGGSRVTFLCGGRALGAYRTLREAVAGSVQALSVLPEELPSAIARLQAEGKELRRQIKEYQARVAAQEAQALADAAVAAGSTKLVMAALHGWDAGGLKLMASKIVERAGHAAVLVSEPAPAAIVVARAPDVALDAGAVLKELLQRHGGKGGGRPELAQGGGICSAAADVLETARQLLSSS